MIAALCIAAVPTYAAEEEARVLILNGLDPYLPAYLAIDSAMLPSGIRGLGPMQIRTLRGAD